MRIRSVPLFTAIGVLCLVTQVGCNEDDQNPFQKAAIGDWATYKCKTEAGTFKVEMRLKSTVIAKDEKDVTVKQVMMINGNEASSGETKYDFTKPLDFVKGTNLAMKDITELKKVNDGKETITIGTSKYDCKWQAFKLIFKAPSMKGVQDGQLNSWTCYDAPLGGLVKMETTSVGSTTTMVLEESGKAK